MTKRYWIYKLLKDSDIYAYTDDKEIAKYFELQRNMKKFKKIKADISKEDINYLAKEYQLCKLEIEELNTCNHSGNSISICKIAMTGLEKLDIDNIGYTIKNVTLPSKATINPLIFNNKIYKALKTIGYTDIYPSLSFINGENNNQYLLIDKLMLFIKNFGKTLKEGD